MYRFYGHAKITKPATLYLFHKSAAGCPEFFPVSTTLEIPQLKAIIVLNILPLST